LPNVGPYIYDVSISGFTRSSIYIYDISSLRVKVAYVQFVTMLTKLQKALSQDQKFWCSKTTIFLLEWTVP